MVLLAPFALRPALPAPDGGSSRPRLLRGLRPTPRPPVGNGPAHPPCWLHVREGDHRDGSHVHDEIDRSGRRPALPRQHRHAYAAGLQRGLPTARATRLRSRQRAPAPRRRALQTGPDPPGFEPASRLRSVEHWFTHVAPSDLARRARTVWQYRHVPPSSGPLATLPDVPQVGLPPASSGRCDDPTGTVSHRPSIHIAPRGAQLRREKS